MHYGLKSRALSVLKTHLRQRCSSGMEALPSMLEALSSISRTNQNSHFCTQCFLLFINTLMHTCMHGARDGGQHMYMFDKYLTTELHPLLVFLLLYLPVPQCLFSFNSKPTKQYSSTGRDQGLSWFLSGSKVSWRNDDKISPHLFLQYSCNCGPMRQGAV